MKSTRPMGNGIVLKATTMDNSKARYDLISKKKSNLIVRSMPIEYRNY